MVRNGVDGGVERRTRRLASPQAGDAGPSTPGSSAASPANRRPKKKIRIVTDARREQNRQAQNNLRARREQRLTELEAELDQAKRQNQLLEAQIAELRSIILASMSGTKPDVTTMTQQIKPADLAATATTIAMPQPRQETTTFSVDDIFGEKLSDGATNVPSRDTATSPFSAFDRLSGTGLSPFLTNLDQSSSTGLTPSTSTTNQTSSSQPKLNQSSDSGRNSVASNRPAASSAAISFPFEPATFDIPAPDPGASWLTDTTVSNMPWEQPPGVWPSANAQSSTQAEPYDVSSLEFLFGWDSANVNPARADPTHFFDTAAIMFP